MLLQDTLINRRSTRAFLQRPVMPAQIETILELASHSPSGANIQPWQVAVVTGTTRQHLVDELEQAFRQGSPSAADYPYYPERWGEPYKGRRRACGLQMYQTLGIQRQDKQRQLDQWAANFRGFDAPVILFLLMDACMQTGAFIDMGMFMQSLILAAEAEGLATCPQAALAEYPAIVKEVLGYPQETILVAGIALGYADERHLVNSYRTPREPVDRFTRFFK